MYEELSEEQKALLNAEQQAIVDSKERYIVVSASPGCGKTFCLVKKIEKEMELQRPNFGIIACSFTREASKQLVEKLESNVDLSLSFVGTIDSFILTGIMQPFLNRCLKYLIKTDKRVEANKLIVSMPPYTSESNEIARFGENHPKRDYYYREWLKRLADGQCEICFCGYLLAIEMIKNMPEVRSFLSSRFTGLYVDEAQDMNEFQFDLVNTLKEECGLKIFLIGDKNQSIYEFRGARPTLFASLKSQGYATYPIDVSVRCEKSIMDFAHCFLENRLPIVKNKLKNVHVFEKIKTDELVSLLKPDVETLWLCETNAFAEKLFAFSNKFSLGYVFTKPIDIKDAVFSGTYMRLLEELLKFRLNFQNPVTSMTYSIEDIQNVLLDYATERDVVRLKPKLINCDGDVSDYLFSIFASLGITISPDVKNDICTQLGNPICFRHYFMTDNSKRIMTIHGAKGLQAKRVIVNVYYEDRFYDLDVDDEREEKFRVYFVAFSRAEKELYIFFQTKNKKDELISQNRIRSKINLALEET